MQIIGGALSFGSLVAFLEYVQRFYKPVQDLAEKFNVLQSAMAAAERIFAVLDSAPEITDPPRPAAAGRARGAVEFRDVSFSYKPGEAILRNISLKIEPGEMVAIVGATGAGKIVDHQPARAALRPPVRSGPARRPRHPRVLPEPPAPADGRRSPGRLPLLGDGRRQHLASEPGDRAGGASRSRARASARTRFIRRLPQGYDTEVGERGALLSVGQKQLLSFARALAHDPPLLILDEATSSVDSESEALIQEALDVLFAGRTSIVIAHRLSTIRGADRIVTLHKGRIRESGTHAELMLLGGIYARLHRLQSPDPQRYRCGR